MRFRKGFWILAFLATTVPLAAKYILKPLEPKAAAEYESHQDFQDIVIGAQAAISEIGIMEWFDSKKIFEKKLMPVLLVLENNNDFPVRVREQSIFLILPDGTNVPAMPFGEAFLRAVLKRPLSSYSTHPGLMIQRYRRRHKEMFDDFEHKHFGEKLIAPHDSDYGIIFFDRPDQGDLKSHRLYLPEVENVQSGDELMFFELELGN